MVKLLDGKISRDAVQKPMDPPGSSTDYSTALLPVWPWPDHDCIDVMDKVFSSQCDLTDQTLKNLNSGYFTNDSSFLKEGEHLAGYSLMTLNSSIEAKPLPK